MIHRPKDVAHTGQTVDALRLEALARVVGAPARGGGLDGLLVALAEGVLSAFGLEAAVSIVDDEQDAYVVRAVVGRGADSAIGARFPTSLTETVLGNIAEQAPDVFSVPHHEHRDWPWLSRPSFPDGSGPHDPGHPHSDDAWIIRLRSSQGRRVGLLSVHRPGRTTVPGDATIELLRLYATVGANAIENEQLQRQLATLQAEREMEVLRRDLFRSVSHELRTPLTSIRGLAHLAAKQEITDQQRREFVEVIGRQSEHLTSILNDLLVAERAAAGRLPVSAQEVDVDAAISEAVGLAGLTADPRVRVARSSETAVADPRRVVQAVTNLLANAAAYAPDGLIHVQAWRQEDQVLIEVEDDGPGIPADELDEVFNRFHRGSPDDAHGDGAGLGLYVTKGLVEAMGGRISCRSQRGVGTRFTIELPAAG